MDTTALQLVQTVILAFALGVALWQLAVLRQQVSDMAQQNSDQFRWEKRKATFEYLQTYITNFQESNRELQKRIGLLIQNGQPLTTDVMRLELDDEETRSKLFHLVAYFENLAIGISHYYFVDSVAQDLFGNVVVSTYRSLVPYIEIRREETGINVGNNFEQLALRWEMKQNNINA